MCDRCEALGEEVAYLRERLGEQLNKDLVRVLMKAFGFTCAEARVVSALHQARGVTLNPYEIGDLTRGDHARPDYDGNTVQVMIMRIRRKAGAEFIVNFRAVGYALSDAARLQVVAAIKADTVAETIDAPVVQTVGTRWDAYRIGELSRLHFVEGLHFSEVARRMGLSRNACIGAANRYLRAEGQRAYA